MLVIIINDGNFIVLNAYKKFVKFKIEEFYTREQAELICKQKSFDNVGNPKIFVEIIDWNSADRCEIDIKYLDDVRSFLKSEDIEYTLI